MTLHYVITSVRLWRHYCYVTVSVAIILRIVALSYAICQFGESYLNQPASFTRSTGIPITSLKI